MDDGKKMIATNSYARYNYHIEDSMESGIVLRGDEVKSLREGKANLKESYAAVTGDEVFLHKMHIPRYSKCSDRDYDPERTRKLLLHKAEIRRLSGMTREKGLTIIPLKLYFKDGIVKAELGICRGKKQYDKRQAIRERESLREVQRARRQ